MGKYQVGDWIVDVSKGLLQNQEHNVQIEPKCMELLALLIEAKGALVTRTTIMESLWNGRYVSDHAVNNVVAMLRKHLKQSSDNVYIKTQPKKGYFLSQPVSSLSNKHTDIFDGIETPQTSKQFFSKGKLKRALLVSTVSILLIAFVIALKSIVLPKSVPLTKNASDFFLALASQTKPAQSKYHEWQIGMYESSGFRLFDYSATTLLGRPSIIGWINRGFHAGFLNTSEQDEDFPGNVFKGHTLALHPGDNSAEIVLRYRAQVEGQYLVSVTFFAMDTIECLKCTSDGVNVSVRVKGTQYNKSRDLLGFGETNTYELTNQKVTLSKGDTIDFIVMPRSTFFDDVTTVNASVSLIQ